VGDGGGRRRTAADGRGWRRMAAATHLIRFDGTFDGRLISCPVPSFASQLSVRPIVPCGTKAAKTSTTGTQKKERKKEK